MATRSGITLNNLRKTWVFLILGIEAPEATALDRENLALHYWEVLVGNSDEIVRVEAEMLGHAGIKTENELILALVEELNRHRYEGAVLVTPDGQTLRRLRQFLLKPDDLNGSLRGFSHANTDAILHQYFDQSLANYEFTEAHRSPPRVTENDTDSVVSDGAPSTFWHLWSHLFRLLPPAELRGDEL